MGKDWKSMLVPVVGVLALGIGNLLGLSTAQIETLKGALDAALTVVFTLIGLYGVWKTHDKKQVVDIAKEVVTSAVDAAENTVKVETEKIETP
jgi:hypothetical protein